MWNARTSVKPNHVTPLHILLVFLIMTSGLANFCTRVYHITQLLLCTTCSPSIRGKGSPLILFRCCIIFNTGIFFQCVSSSTSSISGSGRRISHRNQILLAVVNSYGGISSFDKWGRREMTNCGQWLYTCKVHMLYGGGTNREQRFAYRTAEVKLKKKGKCLCTDGR